MFAILVMMALFTTFITTPVVMAIYRPDREKHNLNHHSSKSKQSSSSNNNNNLHILACIRGPEELPSLITLINSYTSPKSSSILKFYTMQLIELTHRSSSILMVQRTRKNGFPCVGRFTQSEFHHQIAAAFDHMRRQVKVRPVTSISILSIMHEDICHIAENKEVSMIILPFHKKWKKEEDDGDDKDIEINLGQEWRGVNQRVLTNAPCSVGLFVDRGFGVGSKTGHGNMDDPVKRVCVAFLGGSDSREALQMADRMADHPGMRITVVTFSISGRSEGEIKPYQLNYSFPEVHREEQEREQDEKTLVEFMQRRDGIVTFIEKEARNVVQVVVEMAQSKEYELIIVGKGGFPQAIKAEVANDQVEHEELGPFGSLLASSRYGIKSSVIVIQQHDSGPHVKCSGKRMARSINA